MSTTPVVKRSSVFYAQRYLREHPKQAYKFLLFLFYLLLRKNPIVTLSTLQNGKMMLDLTSHIDRTIFFHGFAEKELSEFLQSKLRSNSVFFDIGANSGYFSLMAAVLSPQGTVHAFEPVPKTFEMLQESVKKNNMKNVIINNVCIGSKNGTTTFFLANNSDVSSLRRTEFQKKTEVIKCRMMTLERYCREKKIGVINVMKIDVEGYEYEILTRSRALLIQYKPFLIIEFSNVTSRSFSFHPNEMYDFLTKLGYKIYRYERHKLILQEKKEFYNEDLYCKYEA